MRQFFSGRTDEQADSRSRMKNKAFCKTKVHIPAFCTSIMQRNCCQNVAEGRTNICGGSNPSPEIAIIAKLPMFLLCGKLSANRLLVSRGNLKRADHSLINSRASCTSNIPAQHQSGSDSTFWERKRQIWLDLILHCLNWQFWFWFLPPSKLILESILTSNDLGRDHYSESRLRICICCISWKCISLHLEISIHSNLSTYSTTVLHPSMTCYFNNFARLHN